MPFGPCFASFKNSRIYPRPATISADTDTFETQDTGAGGSPNGNTVARPQNENRTYLQLRNDSATEWIMYGYEDRVDLDTTGFPLGPLEAVIIDSPQEVYTVVKSGYSGPVTTYWEEGIG